MKTINSGFTLAEVLVSIVIGAISIAAAFASYNYFNKSYKSVSPKVNKIRLLRNIWNVFIRSTTSERRTWVAVGLPVG